MNFRSTYASGAVIATALALALPLRAGASGYTFTDLGSLGGQNVGATAIGNTGAVVGYSDTPTGQDGFEWIDGVMHDLTPGISGGSYASGINYDGDVVGSVYPPTHVSSAFLYIHGTSYGTYQVLGLGNAAAVNHWDAAVGSDNTGRAVEWASGKTTYLTPANGPYASALSININGLIAGYINETGTIWTDGIPKTTGTNTVTNAINNNGEAVGYVYTTTAQAAAYISGVWHILSSAGQYSVATCVNINGVIGGYVGSRAVIWPSTTSAPVYLDTQVPSGLYPPSAGFALTQAVGVNDYGHIAVDGTLNGLQHAWVMIPK